MGKIKHKLIVMSGKGGVGKSTVAANLAYSLAERGYKTGLLDVDLHGPSIPKMLGIDHLMASGSEEGLIPVEAGKVLVMSVGLVMPNNDDAIVWRGPMKIGVIKQLLSEVEWGELDYLVVDCPPGTGDEPLSVCQMAGENAGAVMVTTPQEVSGADVAKSLNFCKQLKLPVYGLIENMSGFICPHCGEMTAIFSKGGGEALASRFQVPFAGQLPLDPAICQGGDEGKPFSGKDIANDPAAKAFSIVLDKILANI